jgi:hypothetical protein
VALRPVKHGVSLRASRNRTARSPGLAITHLPLRLARDEYNDAILLVRAYNCLIHGRKDELDEASVARLPEARTYIRRRERPPYWD